MSSHNKTPSRTIKVDYLARVEGEGAMFIKAKGNEVLDVKLKIFEPPRFFEALLRGRNFLEAPDITARICGICPVAYQMSAVHAMENACGVHISGPIRELRRLLYCGEWIASHTLHIYMLHAPDFLGYQSAVEMAKDFPQDVERGLALKKVGNSIMQLLGGREIHPINVRVGGFYHIPPKFEFQKLKEELLTAYELAIATVHWVSKLNFPDFDQDYQFVALSHPKEYPFNEGLIVSNRALCIEPSEYDMHFQELHVDYSNALHCVMGADQSSFHVGPMARFALNFERLPQSLQTLAAEIGIGKEERNPFKSIIIRALEVLFAVQEAIRILDDYTPPPEPFVVVEPRSGTGYAATEAPRGLLYHRYSIDADGRITDACIVPPTSQNQRQIEDDLRQLVPKHLDQSDKIIQHLAEQAIRNFDPCISCATHFLDLTVERI
jgi:sulfhydrogenase subunit alpha